MDALHESAAPAAAPKGLRLLPGGGRTLPHSIEAEEIILAACLLDGAKTIADCLTARINAGSFYDPKHGIVFEKIVELHRRGLPVELSVVAQELRNAGQLDQIGGFSFLTQISEKIPTTAQAAYFIKQVRDHFLLRQGIREGTRLVEDCHAWTGEPIHELFAKYAAKWTKAAAWAQGRAALSLRDVAAAATAKAEDAIAGRVDRTRWLYSGLDYLDEKFTPCDANNEDWYIVLAGLRSQGKSSLARQWCVSNFERGKRGIVFTVETGARGWLMKAAGVHARVDMLNLDRELPEKIARYRKRLAEQETWMEERMWVFDDISSIEGIEAKVREIDGLLRQREIERGVPVDQAHGLDFIMIDYLQQVTTGKRCRTREEEVADVSARLRRQGKAFNITQLILVQLGRKAAERGGPPMLSDLRESGSIEQDAIRVWALELPAEGRDKTPQDANTEAPLMRVWQLKNRNGPTGGVEVIFWKRFTWFEDAPRRGGGGTVRPGDPKPLGGYKRGGDAA